MNTILLVSRIIKKAKKILELVFRVFLSLVIFLSMDDFLAAGEFSNAAKSAKAT